MAIVDVDIYLTRGLLALPGGNTFKDFPADAPVTFEAPTTFFYPAAYDGLTTGGGSLAFVPTGPAGSTLVALTPFVKAHTVGTVLDITDDTSGWGFTPPPEWSPYLAIDHFTAGEPAFDTFPATTDPADIILCGASVPVPIDPDDNYFSDPLYFNQWGTGSTTQIVLSEYGWRFSFETASIPPRRILGRPAARTIGGGNTVQSGNRTLGGIL